MGFWSRLPAALALLMVLISACGEVEPSASGAPTASAPFSPTFADAECPPDVELRTLVEHSCGYLTVLENRAKPDGRTIKLFVVRTPPPEGEPRPWSMIGFGGDLGEGGAGAAGTGAARTRAVVYTVDLRGIGHSMPDLACPEVDALSDEAAEAVSADDAFRLSFLDAVRACRERLVGEGIELAAYGLEESAADLEDLRVALGLEEVAYDTKGTTSRIMVEALRRYPDHVRYAVMDSPQFPQHPEPAVALEAFEYAFQQLAAACGADAACAELTPDLPGLLARATTRLDAVPVEFTAENGANVEQAGRPLTIPVDGSKLLRVVRLALAGDGPSNAGQLPAMIAAAAEGQVSAALAGILANDLTMCAGYRPKCMREPFSLGAYLTQLCRDELPFVDVAAMADAAGDRPAYQSVFGADNPYLAACEVWDVPPANPMASEPLASDIPMLIYTGQLDSTSPLPLAEAAANWFETAYLYEVQGQSHNVMGFSDCTIEIRNAWIVDPASPPEDAGCLTELRTVFASDG